MKNSLFERWYGGLLGGAVGGAIAQMDWMTDPMTQSLPDIDPIQDLILSGDRTLEGSLADGLLDSDEVLALEVAFEAVRRSFGDWTVAFPWAMPRSPHPWLTGVWLGTQLGMNGGSRSIPIELRLAHRDFGLQLRAKAEARVRSQSGIGAIALPILMP
jgi:hypothetical protein